MSEFLKTSLALVCLIGIAGAQTAEQKAETVKYVQSLQNDDGGFAAAAGGKSSAPATSAALRCLNMLGAAAKDKASAVHYVRSCCHEGTIAPEPGAPATVQSTSVGLMAMVAAQGKDDAGVQLLAKVVVPWLADAAKTFEEVRIAAAALESVEFKCPKAEAWLDVCKKEIASAAKTQTDAALARTLGGAAVAEMRLGVPAADVKWVLEILEKNHAADGGWMMSDKAGVSDLETGYRIMRAYHMFGVQPAKADKLRAFIASCRNKDGGYGVSPGKPSSVSGTYYALTVSGWLDAK